MIAVVAEMTVRVAARHVSVGIGRLSISGSLAVIMSVTVGIRIAITITVMGLSFGISRSLSIVRNMSLSYRVQSLSNRVQTCARTKWNISVISISIRVAVAVIEGISISTASCQSGK